ncbi:MAG TPA: DUF924 family protein [Gammaproteobacteria bacterium]|nr:DUF924 family protein [Gammaproteobacteria bacterium]
MSERDAAGPEAVLEFWFQALEPAAWWRRDVALDGEIARRFGALHERACRCELYDWRRSAAGRLAEVIVLDQFSRNLYRDQPRAFAQDGLALALAQTAVAAGADAALPAAQRSFFYLPYMHSESLLIHQQALALFTANGIAQSLDYERRHLAILERFGRYPHRNAALGRTSTPAELAFLREPDSSF